MNRRLIAAAMWLLGALIVAGPLADEAISRAQVASDAPSPQTAANPITLDPSVRFMGVLEFTPQSAGDAIAPDRNLREVAFYLDDAGPIAITARAISEPLTLEVFDANGQPTGRADLPAGQQVPIQAHGTRGAGNVIRIRRSLARPESAAFELSVSRAKA